MSLHNSVHTSETATVIGQIDIVASGDISTINPLSLVQCGQPALWGRVRSGDRGCDLRPRQRTVRVPHEGGRQRQGTTLKVCNRHRFVFNTIIPHLILFYQSCDPFYSNNRSVNKTSYSRNRMYSTVCPRGKLLYMRINFITDQNWLLSGRLGLEYGYFITDFTSYPSRVQEDHTPDPHCTQ